MSSRSKIGAPERGKARSLFIAAAQSGRISRHRWWSGDLALRILRSRELIIFLVCLGTLLRVSQYFANRSLWHDEALLALNLVDRPLSHAARPLDFGQAAPVGFLLAEGIAI